jgi:hypothetical protein
LETPSSPKTDVSDLFPELFVQGLSWLDLELKTADCLIREHLFVDDAAIIAHNDSTQVIDQSIK